MKLTARYIPLFVFLFWSGILSAGLIDSLEILLSKSSGKEKIIFLNRLAEEYRNSNPDKTNEYAELAIEESKKMNFPEGEADAYHKKGVYFYFIDEYDKSLAMYKKSLELARKLDNKKLVAQALSWIGSLYRVQGNHKAALENYYDALTIAKEIDDKSRIIYCLRSIGDDYRMQQENEKALSFFNEATKIADEIHDLEQKAYILTISGEVYRLQSDFTRGIKSLNEAASICFKTKNYNLLANNLYGIGEIYLAKNEYEKALDYYSKALATAREIKDKIRISDCYSAMGDVYRMESDFDKALEYFKEGLREAQEISYPNGLAYCYMVLGDVMAKKGQPETAIEYLIKSKEIAESVGDKHRLSEVYSQLGEIYEQKLEYKKAEQHYMISYDISREIGNHSTIASVHTNLGQIALARNDYKGAIENGEKALAIAREIGITQSIVDASKVLYDAYKNSGKYKESLSMLELNKRMSDTLKAHENTKKIFQQQIKFEYEEEKAKEKIKLAKHEAEQEAKLKTQRVIIIVSIVGLIMLLSLAVVIYISNRKQRHANILLARQNRLIQDQKQEITDSINYAQRIQSAIMPEKEEVYSVFPKSFILYKPKDIVSGDFFYFHQQVNRDGRKGNYIIAVADCTGHGVPGAFMSMISHQKLEQAVSNLYEPRNILKRLNKRIKTTLKQHIEDSSSRDGLDIALLSCRKTEYGLRVKFSAANRPLWIVTKTNGKIDIDELKVTKTPIAGFADFSQEYLQHEFELKNGDTLYMFSDGFADQFGGPNNKKMGTRRFKNFLLEVQSDSMEDQQNKLTKFFNDWKGNNQQIDDILVIGIRV